MFVFQSTTEIPQKHLEGLPRNFVQTFMVLRRLILWLWRSPDNNCHKVWFRHSLRISCNNFCDIFTSPLVQSSAQIINVANNLVNDQIPTNLTTFPSVSAVLYFWKNGLDEIFSLLLKETFPIMPSTFILVIWDSTVVCLQQNLSYNCMTFCAEKSHSTSLHQTNTTQSKLVANKYYNKWFWGLIHSVFMYPTDMTVFVCLWC